MALLAKKSTRPESPSGLRVNSVAAGYMELEGAAKDGECAIVTVENGISKERGCCDLYGPVKGADEFKCGECKYVR